MKRSARLKVKIHTLFQYLLETTEAAPEAIVGFSLSASPRLGDYLDDLDPNLSLDWNGRDFRGLPELRDHVLAQAGLTGICTPCRCADHGRCCRGELPCRSCNACNPANVSSSKPPAGRRPRCWPRPRAPKSSRSRGPRRTAGACRSTGWRQAVTPGTRHDLLDQSEQPDRRSDECR